jgi:hypothetical protein
MRPYVCHERPVQLLLLRRGPENPSTQMIRICVIPGVDWTLLLLSQGSLLTDLPGLHHSRKPLLHTAAALLLPQAAPCLGACLPRAAGLAPPRLLLLAAAAAPSAALLSITAASVTVAVSVTAASSSSCCR